VIFAHFSSVVTGEGVEATDAGTGTTALGREKSSQPLARPETIERHEAADDENGARGVHGRRVDSKTDSTIAAASASRPVGFDSRRRTVVNR